MNAVPTIDFVILFTVLRIASAEVYLWRGSSTSQQRQA